MTPATRKCQTCRRTKRADKFPSPAARRCTACRERAESAVCEVCGAPSGFGASNQPRKTCGARACRNELLLRRRAEWGRAKPKPTRRACVSCERTFPLTTERYAPTKRGPDGEVERFDYMCRKCRAAEFRDRYRSNPAFRERVLASSKRRRLEMRARMETDPVFAEEYRAKHRAWQHSYDERRKAQATEPPRQVPRGGAEIPAGPIASFIDKLIARERNALDGHGPDSKVSEETICAQLGISDRSLRDWRDGKRLTARLDTVDIVLSRCDVLWFDVYDAERYPDEHAIAAEAFEGEEAA